MESKDDQMRGRIMEISRTVCAWSESKGKSLAWLVRKYDTLGSAKTLRDMRDGSVEGYDLERQLANYEAALSLIGADDPGAKSVHLITTLTGPVQLRRAVLEAMTTTGNDRVLLLLGDSGAGKTWTLKCLASEYDTVRVIECKEVWSDAPGAMLCDILEALIKEVCSPATPAYGLFRRVVEELGKRRVTLCFDEAHHMGPRCLNTVKGLVNSTPGEFVLAGQPTLWSMLNKVAHLELRQLTTNRLRERITLSFNAADCTAFIATLFPDMSKEECREAAASVCERAASLGNMAFVRDTCAAAARKAEDPRHPVAAEWVKAAAATASKK